MTVNYFLDTTTSAILLVVQHKGRKFRKSTGHIIKSTSDWNKKEQRLKSSNSDFKAINSELESLEGHVKKIISDYKIINNMLPTLEYVKNEINNDPNEIKDKSFNKLLKEVVNYAKENLKKNSWRDYRSFETLMERYQKEERVSITFQSIDHDFIEKFKKYNRKRNVSPYTIKKRLTQFVTFLNFGVRNKYLKSFEPHLFEMKASTNYGDKVYLTDQEIEALEKLTDLIPVQERTRDAFLLQCYTGLRVSDLRTLKHENINNKFIQIVIHKTERPIIIPLTKRALSLTEKHRTNGQNVAIHVPSEDDYNRLIKEVCANAGIKDKVALFDIEDCKGTMKYFVNPSLFPHIMEGEHLPRTSF